MKCDVDIRVNLYIPAMLPGGTTMFQRGFKEHDKKELTVLPPSTNGKIRLNRQRQWN